MDSTITNPQGRRVGYVAARLRELHRRAYEIAVAAYNAHPNKCGNCGKPIEVGVVGQFEIGA